MIKFVVFTAPWCMPCKKMKPILKEFAAENAGQVEVEIIDIEENPQSAIDLNIKSVPTIIIYKNNEIVKVLHDYHSREMIYEVYGDL